MVLPFVGEVGQAVPPVCVKLPETYSSGNTQVIVPPMVMLPQELFDNALPIGSLQPKPAVAFRLVTPELMAMP